MKGREKTNEKKTKNQINQFAVNIAMLPCSYIIYKLYI